MIWDYINLEEKEHIKTNNTSPWDGSFKVITPDPWDFSLKGSDSRSLRLFL